jgi:phage terminase large subunit-like protein
LAVGSRQQTKESWHLTARPDDSVGRVSKRREGKYLIQKKRNQLTVGNMMKNFKDLHKKQKLSPPLGGGDKGEVF